MRKNIWKWAVLLVAAVVCVGFASCGDDDDEDNKPAGGGSTPATPTPALVGLWENEESGVVIWFGADGTGYYFLVTPGLVYGFFTYEYDVQQKTLTMNQGNDKPSTSTLRDLDAQKFITEDSSGLPTTFFRRASLSIPASLVGTWRFQDDDETSTIVFRADGTGYRSETVEGETESATYKFVYDAKYHVAIVVFDNAGEKDVWYLENFDDKSFELDGEQYVKQ